ncbi:MAG: monomeric [FeFe] hydrogenase [Spirochaetaceae bacterium]|jgi:[FeFe] hydrogenase (group B1/B3)|nr:monomeric [FeFe] hydrogenase [Spirochaetaceae bacterium]
MLNINNNAALLKREILVRIAKLQLEGNLLEGLHTIPKELAPTGSKSIRCCIYHDREIIRQRVIARLGFSLDQYDEGKRLAQYAEDALVREKPTWPMLTVLDEACNACVRTHFMVTNACQACLARPCMMNCPKKAIDIKDSRAAIDSEKCVNCGICLNNCPYHAIIKIPVPCEEACPVGAITKNEDGKERIDYHKCTFCGNCMRECPFGAMMDKSQLVDVIKHIMDKKNVVALYAPAAAAQFRAEPGQLEGALLEAGFSGVMEVALGADITADKEAEEFEERMEKGEKMMTTSCCPAYVRAVRRHVPDLADCISETHTPMHYTAELAKKEDPDCITVFIGPCLAKRREGMDDEFIDYVISIEEIGALFVAKEIDVSKSASTPGKKLATASGRNFAQSGGVAQAVKLRLKDPAVLKAAAIDGLDKDGMKRLAELGKIHKGQLPHTDDTPNLIEVMSCAGGCIAGPSVITNPKVALRQLAKYAEATTEQA